MVGAGNSRPSFVYNKGAICTNLSGWLCISGFNYNQCRKEASIKKVEDVEIASITIHQIIEQLEKLPAEKLPVVYDFVSFLTQRGSKEGEISTDILQIMLASENILKQDWDRPEEDEAWADL